MSHVQSTDPLLLSFVQLHAEAFVATHDRSSPVMRRQATSFCTCQCRLVIGDCSWRVLE